MKKFFENIKWYEWAMMAVFAVTLIAVSVVEHSSAVVICNSLIGIVAVFFVSKGLIIGQILGIVQGIVYCILSAQNRYFGEVIVCACVTIPLYLIAIFTWIKNRQDANVVKVNKRNFGLLEWAITLVVMAVVGVGVYFLLKAFNTANLILSTFSVVFTMTAGYLLVRRCEYSFVFYMISNMICIGLWTGLIVSIGDISLLPTVLCYCIFLILNIFGIVNWAKLKRTQKPAKDEKNEIKEKENYGDDEKVIEIEKDSENPLEENLKSKPKTKNKNLSKKIDEKTKDLKE